MKKIIIIIYCFTLLGCKSEVNNKINSIQNSNINNWIEVQKIDSEWVYKIPCRFNSNTMKIQISKKDDKNILTFDTGLETQWFDIKKIEIENQEKIYKTVLPFDTTDTIIFKYHYIDNKRLISEWNIENEKYYFIPISDTLKLKRKFQKCN